MYYGSTTTVSAGGTPSATVLYTQYVLTLGYSFNRTGAALTLTTKAPVYIKCAPQSNGSAIIDADTPYVQALPSTEDGKIYIYLGIASSATAVEMSIVHPVYYYKDGCVRPWTNVAAPDIQALTTAEIQALWADPITFSIYNESNLTTNTYQARPNTTWGEWINSVYNTDGLWAYRAPGSTDGWILSSNDITIWTNGNPSQQVKESFVIYEGTYYWGGQQIIEDDD